MFLLTQYRIWLAPSLRVLAYLRVRGYEDVAKFRTCSTSIGSCHAELCVHGFALRASLQVLAYGLRIALASAATGHGRCPGGTSRADEVTGGRVRGHRRPRFEFATQAHRNARLFRELALWWSGDSLIVLDKALRNRPALSDGGLTPRIQVPMWGAVMSITNRESPKISRL